VFERFTDRARRVVVLAQEEARGLGHGWIGTEHLLLALLDEEHGVGAKALLALGLDPAATRAKVVDIVGPGEEPVPEQIPFTPRAKKVMELSLREAIALGHKYIGTEHITLALAREGDGVAGQVLAQSGIGGDALRRMVVEMVGTAEPGEAAGGRRATRAMASGPDRITLQGIEVFARHGVEDQEKESGQVFVVDAELELDLGKAGQTDDLADTANYAEVARMIAQVVADERWNLIERVAQRVAEELLSDPRIRTATVTVHKPHAPMPVAVADVSVKLRRTRG
jgi:dihydroneopterin aldolase